MRFFPINIYIIIYPNFLYKIDRLTCLIRGVTRKYMWINSMVIRFSNIQYQSSPFLPRSSLCLSLSLHSSSHRKCLSRPNSDRIEVLIVWSFHKLRKRRIRPQRSNTLEAQCPWKMHRFLPQHEFASCSPGIHCIWCHWHLCPTSVVFWLHPTGWWLPQRTNQRNCHKVHLDMVPLHFLHWCGVPKGALISPKSEIGWMRMGFLSPQWYRNRYRIRVLLMHSKCLWGQREVFRIHPFAYWF